jgi:hypothetical protein
MRSKNKPKPTADEAAHIARIAEMDCVVCDVAGPSEVHEPEQCMWFISLPLCPLCHRGPQGWHGNRLRWTLRKMTELKAINETLRKVFS